MFSKADFAFLLFFVLYLMKTNYSTAFSSESGPTLKAGAVFRWHAPLGLCTQSWHSHCGNVSRIQRAQEGSIKLREDMIKVQREMKHRIINSNGEWKCQKAVIIANNPKYVSCYIFFLKLSVLTAKQLQPHECHISDRMTYGNGLSLELDPSLNASFKPSWLHDSGKFLKVVDPLFPQYLSGFCEVYRKFTRLAHLGGSLSTDWCDRHCL